MKKFILIIILFCLFPLVSSNNSATINWQVSNEKLNQIDGFFIFYSYQKNYLPPKAIDEGSCNLNPNCIYVPKTDNVQNTFSYKFEDLKNENYNFEIFPSYPGKKILDIPNLKLTSPHYLIEPVRLPAKLNWAFSTNSNHDDINGFFIFFYNQPFFRPPPYLTKELCENYENCIFIQRNDLSQTKFSYQLKDSFFDQYYIQIYTSNRFSSLVGRPLRYNVVEQNVIETKEINFEDYFEKERLNLEIALLYYRLFNIQIIINNEDKEMGYVSQKNIDERQKLYDQLEALGVNDYRDRGDYTVNFDVFWKIKSDLYFDKLSDDRNIKIGLFYEKLSEIQSKINDGEWYFNIFRDRLKMYSLLDQLGETDYFQRRPDEQNMNLDQRWLKRSEEHLSFYFDKDDIPKKDESVLEKIEITEIIFDLNEIDEDDFVVEEKQNLIWPVELENVMISSCYGWRRTNPNANITWHDGIDIPLPVGTNVLATADGTVFQICDKGDNCGDRGSFITLKHNNLGTYSQYNHLSTVNVNLGDKVTQGQIIGLSGNTGKSFGPHLDFKYYFGLPMSHRVREIIGNPICYLPLLPNHDGIIVRDTIKNNFDEYFSPTAESCTWGRITNRFSGGDGLGGITKCPFFSEIDYQKPSILARDETLVEEFKQDKEDKENEEEKQISDQIYDDSIFSFNRDFENVLKVMEYAKYEPISNRRCLCEDNCRDYLNSFEEYYDQEIDLLLLVALMMQESSCRPHISSGSSIGLMQINTNNCDQYSELPNDIAECETLLKQDTNLNIEIAIDLLKNRRGWFNSQNHPMGNNLFCGPYGDRRTCEAIEHDNMYAYEFWGCGRTETNDAPVYYSGWQAVLRSYNGWGCDINYTAQDYFVDNIIERFLKLEELYDDAQNLHIGPICGTDVEGKGGLDLSNRECANPRPDLDCWSYTVYADRLANACPGGELCCLKEPQTIS